MPQAAIYDFAEIAKGLAALDREKAPPVAAQPAPAPVPSGGEVGDVMSYLRAIAEAGLYPGLDGAAI